MEEVFVTGLGIVSALGSNVNENLDSLKSDRSGIKKRPHLDGKGKNIYMGRIESSNEDLKKRLAINKVQHLPRTALLGMLAAQEAIGNNSANDPEIRVGIINGTTTGGMDQSEIYFQSYYTEGSRQGFARTSYHDLGATTQLINDHLGLDGYQSTISTACSSSANGIMLGARMIKNGLLDRVIVGGTDALTTFTVNGFESLMIYDNEHCQPFGGDRKGLNLGEGAGYLMLENERSISKSRNEKIAKCIGWANANDAYHQTGTSENGKGALLAMEKALGMANISPDKIDYLNAHGTATKNNDQSEMAAIDQLFHANELDFSSTKGFTGHTLGASGGIEAVISVLALSEQCAFSNYNRGLQMPDVVRLPNLIYKSKSIKYVMSNSFGFGGNSTSLVFSSF